MNFTKLLSSSLFLCATLLCLGSLGHLNYASLSAQAPTDEWRRPGVDAMVAEPGQAASVLSNPAGLKTQEDRQRLFTAKNKAGRKYAWIADFSIDASIIKLTLPILRDDPSSIGIRLFSQVSLLERMHDMIGGYAFGDAKGLALLKAIPASDYSALVINSRVGKLPIQQSALTVAQLRSMTQEDLDKFSKAFNSPVGKRVIASFAEQLKNLVRDVANDIGIEQFSRIFGFTYYGDDKADLVWAFYFGFEQKLIYRSSENLTAPIDFTVRGNTFKTDLSLEFQLYGAIPLRLAFAYEWEQIPGFTFGLGLKVVPYFGFNQEDLGRQVSDYLQERGELDLETDTLYNDIYDLMGMNLGIDLGVQFHFGAISPELEYLHAGLKISDIIGFNIPLDNDIDSIRYAIDFDFGLYAEHQWLPKVQLFGGAEIIQLRGIFEPNSYSALLKPIEHLRLLLGIAFFDNMLRVSLEFYNNMLSPSVMLNLGIFQMNVAMHIDLSESYSLGFVIGFRLRGPHDGFHKNATYRTYNKKLDKFVIEHRAREETTEQ